MRRTRLVPKVSAPASAATATTAPSSALRTGTAVLPRPVVNAIRTPIAALTGTLARVVARSTRDGRSRFAGPAIAAAGATRAIRHAGHATHPTSRTTI